MNFTSFLMNRRKHFCFIYSTLFSFSEILTVFFKVFILYYIYIVFDTASVCCLGFGFESQDKA